ncbi:MAG: hypothetical protein ABFR75_10845 [Acidobacteriota bacterium]
MKGLLKNLIFILCIIFYFSSCNILENSDDPGSEQQEDIPTELLMPENLQYIGAFRLPGPDYGIKSWAWGGYALTYFPGGDTGGSDDGYPGSLFGTGHAWEYQVSEISIPVPVVSDEKNLSELNIATVIQPFSYIFDVRSLEIPRGGLAYLPKKGEQSSDKLYFCWGFHMQDGPPSLTHGWSETDLLKPDIKRGWFLGGLSDHIRNMSTNDYLFDIPSNWAKEYSSSMELGTGRFRDGGWSGQGPSIFAIAPWNDGSPPQDGSELKNIPLLLYTSTYQAGGEHHRMDNYHHSDEWSGAAWLTKGNKAAIIFAGTKGTGDCWYGDSNGPCLDCEGERGWWSTGFEGQFIFFDPSDLAAVASGDKEPWEPQPYAKLNIDKYLYHINSGRQWYHLGAIAFDREGGLLYVFEPFGDGEKPLIHVWRIVE